MNFNTMQDCDLKNKTVLLRADLNVPAKDGKVTDTTRIDRLKPTVDYLQKHAGKIIILSHFGRPDGKENPEYSLKFLTPVLEKQWGVKVGFGKGSVEKITLLENLRFHPGEEKNDLAFAKELAAMGDIYVNDAFSAAHRAHASTEAIAHLMPACAGFLMEAELKALNDALEKPKKPVMAIVGGAKISTKLGVLHNMVKKVDYLVLGGGMANTFQLKNGQEMGKSLAEPNMVEEARAIAKEAQAAGCKIVLPVDCIVVDELKAGTAHAVATLPEFPKEKESVDAGPKSIENICALMEQCKTLLWNGPMGVFEIPPFDNATNKLAQHAGKLTQQGKLVSVAGGGDTVSALENAGAADQFSYISTAGGAFLEWMEGKTLPGVAALEKASAKAA